MNRISSLQSDHSKSCISNFRRPHCILNQLVQLVGHSPTKHVVVNSDTDHGLSDAAADFGQDLLYRGVSEVRECGQRWERTLGFW